MYQDIKRQKVGKGQTIAVVVETRVGGNPRKGSYMHREQSIQAPTTIHILKNRTFRGP